MSLHIGNYGKQSLPEKCSISEWLKDFPEVGESSISLSKSSLRDLSGADRYLYVHEGEFAVTTPKDECVKILATDDATTCHIVILRHPESGATCLAHCNGISTEQAISDMVSIIKGLAQSPNLVIECHIAGGFLDDLNLSGAVSLDVLDSLDKCGETIHLKTACITDLNDTVKDGIHWPIIYGLGVDVTTGDIFRVDIKPENKGPNIDIRSAANYQQDKMINIYDHTKQCLTIGPYHIGGVRYMEIYETASDETIRERLSTSPLQEKDHFANSTRAALAIMRQHPNAYETIFGGKPHRYTLQADGNWLRLQDS